ncbi:MAG: type IVB secretion system protein IcmJDotN [bacterium]
MTSLHSIKFTAEPEAWRLFSVRKADPAFGAFSQQVFKRDQYMCRFCGFQAKQFLEVVNLDSNYHNNKLSNLATACCFCMQCFFLEVVGKDDYGGGVLIYLPEISQGDLNGFCHVLFCAMTNATSYRADAQNIYRGIKLRMQIVEKQLGEGMSDPSLFGRVLIDIPDKDRARILKEALPPIRLLPSYTKFAKQVEAWSKDSLEELSTEK